MYVLPDTNTFFSMLYKPQSVPGLVVQLAAEEHDLILFDYVLEELQDVIPRKMPHLQSVLAEFIENTEYMLFMLPTDWQELVDVPQMRDPKDIPILAAAMLSGADILISGDKDFDDVRVPGLMIMKPRAFLDWSEGQK